MGISTSSSLKSSRGTYTLAKGLNPLVQANLSLVHQVNTSVLGTTPTSKKVIVPHNHLVVDPCSPAYAKSTSGAVGVSADIYKFGQEIWGPIPAFSEDAALALKHTGDGHYSTYGSRNLLQVVSPSFAWYKGGDWTFRHKNQKRHVVNRLLLAYSRVLNLALDPGCTETVIDCVPFAWGVNAGLWSLDDLAILTLHALSEAFGSLTEEQRRRFARDGDKRFNICFYTPEEQIAIGRALTSTGIRFG